MKQIFTKKLFLGLVTATIVTLIGIGLSACGDARAQQRSTVTAVERWEYKIVYVEALETETTSDWADVEFHTKFNALGRDGWEHSGVVVHGGLQRGSQYIVFKRRLP